MSDPIPVGVPLTFERQVTYRLRLKAAAAASVGVPLEVALAEVRRAYEAHARASRG